MTLRNHHSSVCKYYHVAISEEDGIMTDTPLEVGIPRGVNSIYVSVCRKEITIIARGNKSVVMRVKNIYII